MPVKHRSARLVLAALLAAGITGGPAARRKLA